MRVNSVSSINQTKETKSINTSSNIEKTQKDYSEYTTFKELKEIPYEEAKENYEAIEKRALELRAKHRSEGIEEGTKGLASRAMLEQLDKVNISNNDELNKQYVLYSVRTHLLIRIEQYPFIPITSSGWYKKKKKRAG